MHIAVAQKNFTQVVAVWKDQRVKSLTQHLAILAARAAPLNSSFSVTAMPARKKSLLVRGWSPVEMLAERICLISGSQLAPGLLQWESDPREQRGLSDQERFDNVAGRLTCRSAPQSPVWIVDDVMTTGATLQAAATALRANEVDIAGFIVLTAPRRTR